MKNQGKSHDNIADGFAKMRDSFSTEQKNLKRYGFEILLKESDQEQHLVSIARKES